jgi:hypothetical protein
MFSSVFRQQEIDAQQWIFKQQIQVQQEILNQQIDVQQWILKQDIQVQQEILKQQIDVQQGIFSNRFKFSKRY